MPDDIHTNFSVEPATVVTPLPPEDNGDDDAPMPPLWKQALGAVAGSLVALTLYTAYTTVAPIVTAWVGGGTREHVASPQHGVAEEETTKKTVSTGARRKRGE